MLRFKLILAFVMSSEIVQQGEKNFSLLCKFFEFLKNIEREKRNHFLFFIINLGRWLIGRDLGFENCQK